MLKDSMEKYVSVGTLWLLVIVFGFIIYMYAVYVFQLLFNWFISPFGIGEIGFAQSMGILLIPGLCVAGLAPAKGKDSIARIISIPIGAHLIGYIAHSFMP